MRFRFILLTCLMAATPLLAQRANPVEQIVTQHQREQGQTLAAELRSMAPAEVFERTGVIQIRTGTGRRQTVTETPFLFRVEPGNGTWKTIYKTGAGAHGGPEKLVIEHTPGLPNRYGFTRAQRGEDSFGELEQLTAAQAEVPLAGSDFWLTDLGLDFLHWPEQQRLKTERRLGRPCDVLESRTSEDRKVVVVHSWIDKETGGILVAEAYDPKKRLVKEFSLAGSGFKKVNGVWHLEEMKMRTPGPRETATETLLRFDLPTK